MIPSYLPLFLASCHARITIQRVLEKGEEEAMKPCKGQAMEFGGTQTLAPTLNNERGWNSLVCSGAPCKLQVQELSYEKAKGQICQKILTPRPGRPMRCLPTRSCSAFTNYIIKRKWCRAETTAFSFGSTIGKGEPL